MKEFTQEDLKDCPPWVQSGAVDQEGDAWGYECTTKDLSYFNRGHHAMIHVKHPPYHIGSGYDAEWWEESAIDRCKMTKTLTQDDFKGVHPSIKSAAIDKDGTAYLYPCKASQVYEETGIGYYGYIACSRLIIGTGYDTTNWQQSAIDRE